LERGVNILSKIFGLPILLAIGCGLLFPYQAIVMARFSFVFLFLLMVWAGFIIDWDKLVGLKTRWREIVVGLFFLFVFFPVLQFVLARFLLSDRQLLLGLAFASLTPVALVAPFFTRLVKGDCELAFLLVIVSTFLCPLITPFMLEVLQVSHSSMHFLPLTKYMLLLVTTPLVLSFLVSRYLRGIKKRIGRFSSLLNVTCLSLLIFSLFGTAASRISLNYFSQSTLLTLLFLAFFQDFGVLFLSRTLGHFFPLETFRTWIVCLSMKNVAISAGILLFYDPRASLPPALVFLAHAFLFNFLALSGYFTRSVVRNRSLLGRIPFLR